MPIDWSGIQTAYLDLQRRKLGLPSREEVATKRAEQARAEALQASQLETAGLSRDKMRAEIADMPGTAEQRNRLVEAQIRNLDEPNRLAPTTDPEMEALKKKKLQAEITKLGLPAPKPGISPGVESNIINRLTTQWDKANSTINELKRQRDLMHTGLDAARKGDMAAGSQAVLVTFQKILDPTSVVRESEYARSAAGQSLLARIQGAADRVAQGGAGVPVAELEAFANLADQFVQNATSDQALGTIRGRVAATADRYGIPHDVIFGVEPSAPAPIVLGGPVPETWIEVAPGVRKKVKK